MPGSADRQCIGDRRQLAAMQQQGIGALADTDRLASSLKFPLAPTGKSPLRAWPFHAPQEGRFAVVTNVGRGMRWTCWRVETKRADTDGEVVWSRSLDAEIKLAWCNSNAPVTGTTKPDPRGEHEGNC